jgi:uncharacterized membrane protein
VIAFLILLAVVMIVAVVGTIREVRLDRPASIPRSHFIDPDQLPPAERPFYR